MSDWKDVWKDAVTAATGKLQSRGKDAADFLKEAAAARKASLESLLAAFADGQIDEATFKAELEDEKRILRAELLAAQAIGKAAAQSAANAFFDVIETAAKGAISGLL
jgi:hypothetical protein